MARRSSNMYLNQFESTSQVRLQQILATLKDVHGVHIKIDLASPSAEFAIRECQSAWESTRNKIVSESSFNSYQQNPQYTKAMLILEAMKIMLTEIGPKRRRKSTMNESTTEEAMDPKPTISTQLSDIAAKIPQTTETATAFSNALASIADKLANKEGLDPTEKDIMSWIKSLPRPVNVKDMIKSGIDTFGQHLLSARMKHIGSLPKVDIDEISKGLAKNYDDASHKDFWKTYDNADKEYSDDHTSVKLDPDSEKRMQKRERGQELARGKLGVPGYGLRTKVPATEDHIDEANWEPIVYGSDQDHLDAAEAAKQRGDMKHYHRRMAQFHHSRASSRELNAPAKAKHSAQFDYHRNKFRDLYNDPSTQDSMNEGMSPDQIKKVSDLGHAIVNYSSKSHGTDPKELAMLNAFSAVGDKLSKMGTSFGPTSLTDKEKKIARLAQLKMKQAGNLPQGLDEELSIMKATPEAVDPGMDNVHEAKRDDLDNDGDNDFADIMIARMMKSGMSKKQAIAKTKDKTYNKEGVVSESDGMVASTQPQSSPTQATFGQAHHYEYQASMARSELYRNSKYAMSMMKQVDPNGEVPPWIAGALTKSANYLDKIFHYLDYYKTFEPEQLPEDMDGDMELGETSGSIARENLLMIMEYSTKLFNLIKPGDKLEGWVAMKLTTASECVSSCKHYMDYVQFEKHAMVDDHFDESRRAKASKNQSLAEGEDPGNEDIAKAQVIISAKGISNKVQDMAEEVAKLSVEELMPLVDVMRTHFGPEAATGFNEAAKASLEALLDLTTKTKEELDTAVTTLQSGGVPAETTDIENAAPAAEEPAATEPAAEEPLGRAKKDELSEVLSVGMKVNVTNPKATPRHTVTKVDGDNITIKKPDGKEATFQKSRIMKANPNLTEAKKPDFLDVDKDGNKSEPFTKALKDKKKASKVKEAAQKCMECGTGTYMEGKDGKMRCDECGHVMIAEAWDTEMHTAKKDKGMFKGKTITDLEKMRAALMQKATRSTAEQKKVKQIDFAIRAKHEKDKWGKVEETSSQVDVNNSNLDEKAVSKQQQKFMGMVYAAKTGEKPASKEVAKVAKGMSKKDARDFAATKHKGLPKKVKEAADFIESQQAVFEQQYGKDYMRQLYAAAWKQFGQKPEGYDRAVSALAETTTLLATLNAKMANHKKTFKNMVAEGVQSDPLNVGYGLEGEVIKQQIDKVNKKIAENKSIIRQLVQEGIIGMLKNISSLNKVSALEEIKSSTPYGVIYTTRGGRKTKKMFESIETRNYWLELYGKNISDPRMIEPETFDNAINTTINGR